MVYVVTTEKNFNTSEFPMSEKRVTLKSELTKALQKAFVNSNQQHFK